MIKERGRLIYRENLPADGDEATSLRAVLGTDDQIRLDKTQFVVVEERSCGTDGKNVTFVLREWEPAQAGDAIAAAEPEHDATDPPAKRSRRG